jgi:hypothetical protein
MFTIINLFIKLLKSIGLRIRQLGFSSPIVQNILNVIDNEIRFKVIFALYLFSDMYRSILQFLVKVKASSPGKLLDSLPRNDVVIELCSSEFKVPYFCDMEGKKLYFCLRT